MSNTACRQSERA